MTKENFSAERWKELDRSFNFYSWSAQGALSPMMVSHAHGMTVVDIEGNEYLDFSSQLVNVNIGHSHPRVVGAIVVGAILFSQGLRFTQPCCHRSRSDASGENKRDDNKQTV